MMVAAVTLPKEWIFMPVPGSSPNPNDAPNHIKYQRMPTGAAFRGYRSCFF
jgi:hypothetical protein